MKFTGILSAEEEKRLIHDFSYSELYLIGTTVLGYLIFRSDYIPDYIPGILGVLLMIAALGYLVDSFANFLFPGYADYETILMLIV